ncbi:DUF192 domain-containing protein [Aliifodinibius sp. S!AR15-10]|nr:DUF192 domain-containing protein [Aliifodinibius sp. S!AR15-10]
MSCQKEKSESSQDNQTKGRTLEYTRQVTFLNMSGNPITTIDVAVADDDDERSTGLMDVSQLPSNKGMLFIFEDEQPRSFWMANTPLSLDIIFVNEDLEIVRIHQNTQPFAEGRFQSERPAKYVVEVNGGFSISHDIQQGMKIEL